MLRSVSLAALVLLISSTSEAAAQNLAPPGASVGLGVTISGKVGSKKYQASDGGTCRHAPDASISGVSASLWMVQYGGSGEAPLSRLNLTLWRPKDGGSDQLSLNIETKSGSHQVETGGGGKNQGEGAVVILPNGPGGRFEIKGKDADGKPIQLTIDCPTFAGVASEGG